MNLAKKSLRGWTASMLALGLLNACLEPAEKMPSANPSREGGASWVEEKVPAPSEDNPAAAAATSVLGQRYAWDASGFTKEFTVDVAEDGDYYLGAWIDGLPGHAYDVRVDGQALAGVSFSPTDEGWQSVPAANGSGDAKVRLAKGTHAVSLRGTTEAATKVERIQLGVTPQAAKIPDEAYREYVRSLVSKSLSAPKLGLEKTAVDNPPIAFAYALNAPMSYTWYTSVYLNQGTSYTFTTSNLSANADPILYVFNQSNPSQSWFNDDYAPPDRNSRIAFPAPSTGYYYVVLRAYASSTGTGNVYQNGNLLSSACPIAGYLMFTGSSTNTGVLNYFTARRSSASVDPRIWLIDSDGYMRYYNDDYSGAGTFAWGYNSRLHGDFGNVYNMLVSSYGSGSPAGTVDVYAKLLDHPDAVAFFPNLNANDAIEAIPYNGNYNCIAWSGGLMDDFYWPPDAGNPWYVAGNPKKSFDNFYGNTCAWGGTCKRYGDANVWKYGNYSSDPTGRIVALWRNNLDGKYTHASVSKPANGAPHGYDWESKPGAMGRLMHPRDALVNEATGGYGHIEGYYQNTGFTPKVAANGKPPEAISAAQSIDRGNSVLEDAVRFSAAEKSLLAAAKAKHGSGMQAEFDRLSAAWTATFPKLAYRSDPAAYRLSPEYKAFADYCAGQGKAVWPQLFDKLETREPIVGAAVADILKDYQALLDEAVQDWARNQVRADGKFVIFSPANARMRMARKLIAAGM
jgi:hypothetical protein